MKQKTRTELEQKIDSIVSRLNSTKTEERAAAGRELSDLGPNAVEPLLAKLADLTKKRKRLPLMLTGMTLGYVVLLIVVNVVCRWIVGRPVAGGFVGGMFGGMLPFVTGLALEKQTRNNSAQALAYLNDVRTVGALAEALEFGDKTTRDMAGYTLCRLLPQLQASDASLLTAKQRSILNFVLEGKEIALMLAVLKAYEQVGDRRALPFVQKLSVGQGMTYRNQSVQDAACTCLPFLEARIEQEQARQSLLRASDGNAASPDVLLRPAEAGVETDPQQLLRAGRSENESGG